MPAFFNLFFCPVSVSVVDVLVLYCVCRGGGSIPPVSFCAGALPRLFRLVLDFKSGGIALTLLGAGHSPQTQKNLPDAVPRDAEFLPLWEDIAVGNWLW